MDRLPTLIALVALCGCEKGGEKQAEPTSRVNAAKTQTKKTDTAAFCDTKPNVAFSHPPLASGTLPTAAKWRWVNVWATWCKPCTEEMPRLVKWREKLGVELQFVSVDEAEDDITAYRNLHPETPPSVRLAKADAQAGWYKALGLDEAAPIPIHIFVDGSNTVRCVRAGGVREQDLPMVEALLAGK